MPGKRQRNGIGHCVSFEFRYSCWRQVGQSASQKREAATDMGLEWRKLAGWNRKSRWNVRLSALRAIYSIDCIRFIVFVYSNCVKKYLIRFFSFLFWYGRISKNLFQSIVFSIKDYFNNLVIYLWINMDSEQKFSTLHLYWNCSNFFIMRRYNIEIN